MSMGDYVWIVSHATDTRHETFTAAWDATRGRADAVIALQRADGARAIVRDGDDAWIPPRRFPDGAPVPLAFVREVWAADVRAPDVCHEYDAILGDMP